MTEELDRLYSTRCTESGSTPGFRIKSASQKCISKPIAYVVAADQGARQVEKGLVGVRPAVVADRKTPETVEPRKGTLDELIAKDKLCMSRHGRYFFRNAMLLEPL